ncbi:hypothetical protein FPZ54_10000 [Sphingomonas suaedae]|uniref:OmpA-like domain-containing protein n=1 Tax=Sphingomonas suaedae TaxID=2599297 RepID=A0A518RFV4_9SPHN|nr:hypothetical protein [Sphingomonas suaedae]QDX26321.1 hypothetical protein FPZ54_10000 [Sphingomonas suaedae]
MRVLLLIVALLALMTAAAARPTAPELGVIAGFFPPATGSLQATTAAAERAGPSERPAAIRALARALLARGSPLAEARLETFLLSPEGAGQPDLADDLLAIKVMARRELFWRTEPTDSFQSATRPDPRRQAVADYNEGVAQTYRGAFAVAETLQTRALATLSAELPADDARLNAMRIGLARTLLGKGDTDGADRLAKAILTVETRAGRAAGRLSADALTLAGAAALRRGDVAEADALLRRAIAIGEADSARRLGSTAKPDLARDAPLLADAEGRRALLLAQVLLRRGDQQGALAAARSGGRLAPDAPDAKHVLMLAELATGTISASADRAEWAIDVRAGEFGIDLPEVIGGRTTLARYRAATDIPAAWSQSRQGVAGARKRLGAGKDGGDPAGAARLYRAAFRQHVAVAWRATQTAPFAWPPEQRRFTAYFDSGDAALTPAAERLVEHVAMLVARTGGSVALRATYYGPPIPGTQQSGNTLIGQAVRARLEALGVDPARVTLDYGTARNAEALRAPRRMRRVDIEILPPR